MGEPKSKNSPASTPDQLVNSGMSATIELSEQEMGGVSGGGIQDKYVAFGKMDDKGPYGTFGYQKG